MTANERFKRRARKYAAEHNISVASATRILREQQGTTQHDATQHDATQHDAVGKLPGIQQTPSYAQALSLYLSNIRPGGADKTSATIDLGPLLNATGATITTIDADGTARPDNPVSAAADADAPQHAAEDQAVGARPSSSIHPGTDGTTPVALDLASLFSHRDASRFTTGQVKGTRGKTNAAQLLAGAFQREIGRFEPILIDTVDTPAAPPRPEARQRLAVFLLAWLVRVSGSEDPQRITTWLRERGHTLDPAQQLMLEILLADPELRAGGSALSSSAEDDPQQYLGNVIALISEELAEAWPTADQYRRSFLDLEQPEPSPPLPGDFMRWPSPGAKGGRCAGLPACRVRCTCGVQAARPPK
jgi:hypothetical protein